MRIRGVAAQDRERRPSIPAAPRSRRDAFEHRQVAGGLAVDRANVVRRLDTGLGRGRIVARRDDAQIELTRQLETDFAVRERLAGFDLSTCAAVR